jgi:biotin carboxyl carrier protein
MDLPASLASPLTELLEFQGAPPEFWQAWTQASLAQLQGELAVLYIRRIEAEPATASAEATVAGWQVFTAMPEAAAARPEALPSLAATVDPAIVAEALRLRVASGPSRRGNWTVRLISIRPEGAEQELLLCVHVPLGARAELTAHWQGLLALVPRAYELGRDRRRLKRDIDRHRAMLEVLWRVLETERFDQASLAFVNELCDRFGCEQVSLLWRGRIGLQLKAVSHGDRLDRRTELAELLEQAGQEAITQWREVTFPNDGKTVTRAHAAYADAARPGHLLSVPLVIRDRAVGAIVLERRAAGFSQSEQWALRILCDQVARPFRDLHRQSAPLWKRLPREVGRSIPRRFSVTTKEGRWFAGVLAAAAIGALFIPVPYRLDAAVVIRTDRMAFVGAPFDGYIESAGVTLGQTVAEGAPLFALATQELQLERVSHLADIAQSIREAEKRLAANQLVEMRIAEAQVAQTQAKLDQVEFRLRSAQVTAPIGGIVVDGEPGKNLGGAVRRGETVVKIAALSELFAELAIDERDIHRVTPGMAAEVTLIADPNTQFSMRITRIIPASTPKDGVNTFPARAERMVEVPAWWRPGMSGVAKIHAGHRPIIWIATHRLIDYIRLTLWI